MTANQPKIDILRFISNTIRNTVFATRSRLIIFCVILFLQFLAVPMIAGVIGYRYPDTYHGLQQKIVMEGNVGLVVGIVKYCFLVALIIISPAEQTSKRSLGKYIFLFWALLQWVSVDSCTYTFKQDESNGELVDKSFHENAVPIYGKVVFSSYNRDEDDHKRLIKVAENLSPNTTGYIVIVQLNDSAYNYQGLKGLYQHFNDYTHDRDYPTHIPAKDSNLSNCLQFNFEFPPSLKKVPALPVQGKYIRILYDPYESGIEMFTDSASAVTPTFDSIPILSHQ